jgi:predicted ester cyclase
MAPTGKSVNIIGMTIFRVENDQIAELWDVWDEAGLLRQLEPTE